MTKKELYNRCSQYFSQALPKAETELHFSSPYQLLVAVMLSAQCTDRRVNMVTPALFEAYPTIRDMSSATPGDILPFVKSVSYPNAKAGHLVAMAKQVVERFDGRIPDDMDELVSLPGVGRKTANVMLAVAFGGNAMPVDTHVFRVSHRIGLVPARCTTPLSVEKELVKYFPNDTLSLAHHWLLLHGRYVCTARSPKCGSCGLTDVCRHFREKDRG
ncbi:MAG: endonuclease III [Bacteroidaceae bacterium]|nr:endonuclease III [Bacteroidaceae bacterium]